MARNIAQEIIEGLREFVDVAESGQPLQEKFNVRTVELKARATRYTPTRVKKTRKLLNASQPIFAQFLGVRPATVRAWECGNNVPSGMAARFLDEIQQNPAFFKARMEKLVTKKRGSKRTA